MNRPHLTGDALKEWRERNNLSQEDLGRLLGTSREWIGKLERGEREVSAEIYLRFENLKKEPKFSSDFVGMVAEEGTPYGTGTLEAEIRALLDDTITKAAGDSGRLGWIREQLIRHVTPPEHWEGDAHSQALAAALAERNKREAERARHSSAKAHEGAG